MKYFRINDTDTVCAVNEEEALKEFKRIFGIKITDKYTDFDFREEFEIDVYELPMDTLVYDGDSTDCDLITITEFINRHGEESHHFTSEI